MCNIWHTEVLLFYCVGTIWQSPLRFLAGFSCDVENQQRDPREEVPATECIQGEDMTQYGRIHHDGGRSVSGTFFCDALPRNLRGSLSGEDAAAVRHKMLYVSHIYLDGCMIINPLLRFLIALAVRQSHIFRLPRVTEQLTSFSP